MCGKPKIYIAICIHINLITFCHYFDLLQFFNNLCIDFHTLNVLISSDLFINCSIFEGHSRTLWDFLPMPLRLGFYHISCTPRLIDPQRWSLYIFHIHLLIFLVVMGDFCMYYEVLLSASFVSSKDRKLFTYFNIIKFWITFALDDNFRIPNWLKIVGKNRYFVAIEELFYFSQSA